MPRTGSNAEFTDEGPGLFDALEPALPSTDHDTEQLHQVSAPNKSLWRSQLSDEHLSLTADSPLAEIEQAWRLHDPRIWLFIREHGLNRIVRPNPKLKYDKTQFNLVLELSRDPDALMFQSPTGSGKSVTALLRLAFLLRDSADQVLILTPQDNLVDQFLEEATSFLMLDQSQVAILTGNDTPSSKRSPELYRNLDQRVVIATPHVLENDLNREIVTEERLAKFKAIVFDETQLARAWQAYTPLMKVARKHNMLRIAMSATVAKNGEDLLELAYHLGSCKIINNRSDRQVIRICVHDVELSPQISLARSYLEKAMLPMEQSILGSATCAPSMYELGQRIKILLHEWARRGTLGGRKASASRVAGLLNSFGRLIPDKARVVPAGNDEAVRLRDCIRLVMRAVRLLPERKGERPALAKDVNDTMDIEQGIRQRISDDANAALNNLLKGLIDLPPIAELLSKELERAKKRNRVVGFVMMQGIDTICQLLPRKRWQLSQRLRAANLVLGELVRLHDLLGSDGFAFLDRAGRGIVEARLYHYFDHKNRVQPGRNNDTLRAKSSGENKELKSFQYLHGNLEVDRARGTNREVETLRDSFERSCDMFHEAFHIMSKGRPYSQMLHIPFNQRRPHKGIQDLWHYAMQISPAYAAASGVYDSEQVPEVDRAEMPDLDYEALDQVMDAFMQWSAVHDTQAMHPKHELNERLIHYHFLEPSPGKYISFERLRRSVKYQHLRLKHAFSGLNVPVFCVMGTGKGGMTSKFKRKTIKMFNATNGICVASDVATVGLNLAQASGASTAPDSDPTRAVQRRGRLSRDGTPATLNILRVTDGSDMRRYWIGIHREQRMRIALQDPKVLDEIDRILNPGKHS